MKFKSILPFAFLVLGVNACTDEDEGVGASVHPVGDLLSAFSNRIDVSSSSVFVDSVLYKADFLYLGQYTDTYLGTTQCEFLSQFDARIGGISVPDTSLFSYTNKLGISKDWLTKIDPDYGNIKAVTNPNKVQVDSAAMESASRLSLAL